MIEVIVKYWLTWACGLIAAALLFCRKRFVTWWKENKRRKAASEFSDRYVLFMKLRELHDECVSTGKCSSETLIEAEETYKHYHDGLHGNGRGDVYIADIRAIHEANLEHLGGF